MNRREAERAGLLVSAGFIDLPQVDDEIFPQYGDINCAFYLSDVIEAALKIFFVCQDANCVGSALGVNASDLQGVEIGADNPSRGRGFFNLGYDVEAAFVGLGDSLVEVAATGHSGYRFLEMVDGRFPLSLGDFDSFVFDYPVKYVFGHL